MDDTTPSLAVTRKSHRKVPRGGHRLTDMSKQGHANFGFADGCPGSADQSLQQVNRKERGQ